MLIDALNYVADMTFCGIDGEWHFKPGYDPQVVLDAIAAASGIVTEGGNGAAGAGEQSELEPGPKGDAQSPSRPRSTEGPGK